jgi:tRNA(fMet)-specific endonuclease VapC
VPFLDTTALLDLSHRHNKARREAARNAIRSLGTSDPELLTSRFNVAELLVGVELCNDPIAERQRIDDALGSVGVIEFDEAGAQRFAKLSARLRKTGKSPGVMDLLIAAVALGTGEPLVTRNAKHFTLIPELVVVGY